LHQFQEQSEAMQRNPHSYQIATGYRTFYSLSLIYQPITKKRLFFNQKWQILDAGQEFAIFAYILSLSEYNLEQNSIILCCKT